MKAMWGVLMLILVLALISGWVLLSKGPTKNPTSQVSQPTNPPSQSPSATPSANVVTVVIKGDTFDPETIQIKKGTTVSFKNEDSKNHWPASNIHPTHGIYPEFDPQKPVAPGTSWEFTFDKVGSWKYHNHLSPSVRGTIEVTE